MYTNINLSLDKMCQMVGPFLKTRTISAPTPNVAPGARAPLATTPPIYTDILFITHFLFQSNFNFANGARCHIYNAPSLDEIQLLIFLPV